MIKRSVAILTCSTLLALVAMPSAQAQDPELESFGAGASATALFLSLLDQDFTFSATSAAVGSDPKAAADGQAALTPLFDTPGAPVESEGDLVEGQDCINVDLPAPVNLVDTEIACVNTAAEVADGSPVASSDATEFDLEVISADVIDQLSEAALRPLLEQLLAGLEPLLTQLDVLVDTPTLTVLIDLLLADLENGGPIATVGVGETSSTASEVESLATSQGVTVGLLPDLLPGVGPLANVVVGDSFSSATYDPATGEVTTDGQAAFLSVDLTGLEAILNALVDNVAGAITPNLPPPLDQAIQDLLDEILAVLNGLDGEGGTIDELVNVTVDQLACPDSPLAAILCFEAGGVHELDAAGLEGYGFTFGEGTKGIEATVLGLSALDGSLELGIGQTAAGANAIPAQAPPVDEPDGPRGPLPQTGADTSLPLVLALFAAATAGLAVVRRTRSA